MTEEARKIRAEIAEAINENPTNIQNYEWVSISNYFDTDYIAEVLKYIKDDNVCKEVKKVIRSAYIVAKRHYEKNTGRPVSSFDYELEKAGKMRALYIELQRRRKQKRNEEHNQKTGNVTNGQSNAIIEEVETLKTQVRELKEQLEKQVEDKKELAAENEELRQENEQLKQRTTEAKTPVEIDNEDISELDDIERLGIDERIIFFSSALGVSLDPEYISQKKMSVLISKLSGDNSESIRTRIVALKKEEEKVNKKKLDGYSQRTKEAANNVYKYVKAVAKSDTSRTQLMRDIMENISLIYQINKEK